MHRRSNATVVSDPGTSLPRGPAIDTLAAGVRTGNHRAVARAISLVEDAHPDTRALLAELFPHAGGSLVIGVTGPPGAGKSSLVDRMTARLRAEDRTVGIVAVDPTSPFSGGAILGDRTETGCNSVTSPGTLMGPRSIVYPCMAVSPGLYPERTILSPPHRRPPKKLVRK